MSPGSRMAGSSSGCAPRSPPDQGLVAIRCGWSPGPQAAPAVRLMSGNPLEPDHPGIPSSQDVGGDRSEPAVVADDHGAAGKGARPRASAACPRQVVGRLVEQQEVPPLSGPPGGRLRSRRRSRTSFCWSDLKLKAAAWSGRGLPFAQHHGSLPSLISSQTWRSPCSASRSGRRRRSDRFPILASRVRFSSPVIMRKGWSCRRRWRRDDPR